MQHVSLEVVSCIQICFTESTTAYDVAFLKVKISSNYQIKFTEVNVLKTEWQQQSTVLRYKLSFLKK